MSICPVCGGEVPHTSYSGLEGKRMKETGECFLCAFWEIRCQNGEEIVIDNYVYGVGKEPSKGERKDFLGMGGRRFDIEIIATGERFTTHNLWGGGEIPERFRDRLPNTARFIDKASREKVGEITCWNQSSSDLPPYPPYSRAGKT